MDKLKLKIIAKHINYVLTLFQSSSFRCCNLPVTWNTGGKTLCKLYVMLKKCLPVIEDTRRRIFQFCNLKEKKKKGGHFTQIETWEESLGNLLALKIIEKQKFTTGGERYFHKRLAENSNQFYVSLRTNELECELRDSTSFSELWFIIGSDRRSHKWNIHAHVSAGLSVWPRDLFNPDGIESIREASWNE